MYSIKRNIEPVVRRRAKNSKAIILTGPRQVGKTTLFNHVFDDVNKLTFDDDILLAQAASDPRLFLLNNPRPLLIDEVQKCPSIFNQIKIVLDNTDERYNYFFTGSQKLQLMEGVSESLAGRVSVVEMDGLSLREIYGIDFNSHFVPTDEYISEREKHLSKYSGNIWEIIHKGSFPELFSNPEREWVDFYRSYISTYLERDVNQIIKAKNHLAFVTFMTAAAARTGQSLNYANIASEVGVSEVTIKEWMSILERSGLIYILKPYCPSVLGRATKTPKLYFRDTGLACYLTRWLTPENLKNGAMAGAMFETFVINEILKSYSCEGLDYDFSLYYYNGRDRKKQRNSGAFENVAGEIDLIIEENGVLYPIEIKLSASPKADMASEFDVLDNIPDKKRGTGIILCLYDRKLFLRDNLLVLPLEYI